MQLPYMLIVQRFGPKNTVLAMTFFSSAFTLLFVPAAAIGWEIAFVARVLLGCSQVNQCR
jgi:hypothetical protein